MKHYTEEELIAYQLQEIQEIRDIQGSPEEDRIRQHLELCADCAQLTSSIAETLRVFSAEPVPQANLDHAWQRLRGSLPALPTNPEPHTWFTSLHWRWLAIPALAALLLAGYLGLSHRHKPSEAGTLAHLGPGPLTDQPRDPALAAHMESAERLLTEINHSSGDLDEATRNQAHDLLVSNALYIRKARQDGDPAEASVLEALDRTLTNLEHDQPGAKSTGKGLHLTLELNTNGLLMDLRILQQNSSQQNGQDHDKKGTQ